MLVFDCEDKLMESVDVHKGTEVVRNLGGALVAGRCAGPRIVILLDMTRIVTSSSLTIHRTLLSP
jgi:hypothetical protein